MWEEIINLLKIQVEEGEEDRFDEELTDLNDWIRREYGRQGLTCEELLLAYNALVKEELHKDGRLLEAYPKLDPRHVGEVIAAYRRTAVTSDVNQILSQGLYLPIAAEPTEADIDAQMEKNLKEAISCVERGINYFDLGNGLYVWLYKNGRIRPSDQEWDEALIQAQTNVREDLVIQKEIAGQYTELRVKGTGKKKQVTRYSSFAGLREKLADRLKNVMNETGDYKKRVRQEAFQICLTTWLMRKAGVTERPTKHLPTTPTIPPPESQKPFSHADYIEALKEQLETMEDEKLSDLQQAARNRNLLDVYELTTAEWNRRHNERKAVKK